MHILELQHINKKYKGNDYLAIDDVSFQLKKGDILALVGESGSGKTTLLRMIAGLEHPDAGVILLNGAEIVKGKKAVPANERNIGLVFQDYALFPHMTIAENVGFGLRGFSKEEKNTIIRETIALTGLTEDLNKYPHQLSGGQQQRVALARALAPRPDILLLDEPFSNLDTILRDQVREEVQQIIKKAGITAILVTHDTKDALCTADTIAVLSNGKLLQYDTPENIYEAPFSDYVAHLFGKFNCLDSTALPTGFQTVFGLIPCQDCDKTHQTARIFCRPEYIETHPDAPTDLPVLKGTVEKLWYLGDFLRVNISVENHDGKHEMVIHIPPGTDVKMGSIIHFTIRKYKTVDF